MALVFALIRQMTADETIYPHGVRRVIEDAKANVPPSNHGDLQPLEKWLAGIQEPSVQLS